MTHTNASRSARGRAGIGRSVVFAATLAAGLAAPVAAQARIGNHTRLERFGIDLGYGVLLGLAFAAYDQSRNDPPQWGKGGEGYAKRAASNVGQFVIQESVTEGLAAAMNRPLDYTHCKCQGFGPRTRHALLGAVTDEMPNGSHPFAAAAGGRGLRRIVRAVGVASGGKPQLAAAGARARHGRRWRSAPASTSFMNS